MASKTLDLTAGTVNARPDNHSNNPFIVNQYLDFNQTRMIRRSAFEVGDVIQSVAIPANSFIERVFIKILTPAVATSFTVHVGDSYDDDGYDNSLDLTSPAGTISTSSFQSATASAPISSDGMSIVFNDAYSGGKLYVADDTINIKIASYNNVSVLPILSITVLFLPF